MPQFYWPRGDFHKDRSTDTLQGHSKKSASTSHIVHNLYFCLPLAHNLHETVERTRDSAQVLLPCQNTAYFVDLKILKHIEYIVRLGWQNVLERFHTAHVSCHSVLFTCMTIATAKVMCHVSHVHSTRLATFLALEKRFLIRGTLWFAKQAWILENLLHSAQGILTRRRYTGSSQYSHYMSGQSDVWLHSRTNCYMLYICTSPPSRPLYLRSCGSAVRHHFRAD